jgi:hypothetical protein
LEKPSRRQLIRKQLKNNNQQRFSTIYNRTVTSGLH